VKKAKNIRREDGGGLGERKKGGDRATLKRRVKKKKKEFDRWEGKGRGGRKGENKRNTAF